MMKIYVRLQQRHTLQQRLFVMFLTAIQLVIAILNAKRGKIQMGAVQTMYIFSLVSRVQSAYVCAITISCKLYRKVLNATLCVGNLLVMAYAVDRTTLACMSLQLLGYPTPILEDFV